MDVSDSPDVSSDDAGLSSLLDTSSISLVCDPCKKDRYYYEAEGYCVDCTHHLCKTCLQHHRRPIPMRHHTLLNKEQMPQTTRVNVFKDECTDKCSVHGDEILKYFCEDHFKFGCTVCVTLEHRTCKVGYITTLSADLFNTQEYKSFKLSLESMVRNTDSIQDTANRNLEEAKRRAEIEMKKIRQFRKEIDNFFDELEHKIVSKLTQIRIENQETIAGIITENKIMTEKLKEIEKEMKEKEDKVQKCRLFVDIKQLNEIISALKKNIEVMERNNKIQELTFIPSGSVTNFIRNKAETFGSLVSFHENFQLDIDSKLIDNIVFLSRERIAIQCTSSDSRARRIVIIDINHTPTKVIPQMESLFCSGLTCVGENNVAVTTETGNIQIYSVTDEFVLKNTTQNTGLHYAIAYTNGVLIGCTLTSPYNLRSLNMRDNVKKTLPIVIGPGVSRPCCIAVHPDHTSIYVCNAGEKNVTRMTIEGELKEKYKPGSDWEPRGVAVLSTGLVYVSDSKNNNIHILTSDLKPYDEIIGARYGIRGPRGLAVCDRERKLYVGLESGKSISVFSI